MAGQYQWSVTDDKWDYLSAFEPSGGGKKFAETADAHFVSITVSLLVVGDRTWYQAEMRSAGRAAGSSASLGFQWYF